MNLEQLYVFPINSPLTSAKRRAIDWHMDKNAHRFGREVTYSWMRRGDERFLRIVCVPVTIDVVFFENRIEFFGAAPALLRILFTKARKETLRLHLQQGLVDAGFVVNDQV